jgi:cytidylate kinase
MGQSEPSPRRIAIDGPAASGKSAVGSSVARTLHFSFIDTGAIYRALTWLVLHEQLDPQQHHAVAGLAAKAVIVIEQPAHGSSTLVVIDGHEVSGQLRSKEVEAAVSEVSAIPEVRRHLIGIQRELAKGKVVMAGRDIGSIVLPDAELKIFLDASPEERVQRRLAELQREGKAQGYAELDAQIQHRDLLDSTRAAAPLKVAADAVRLETDALSLSEVIAAVLELAHRRWPELRDVAPSARLGPS